MPVEGEVGSFVLTSVKTIFDYYIGRDNGLDRASTHCVAGVVQRSQPALDLLRKIPRCLFVLYTRNNRGE